MFAGERRLVGWNDGMRHCTVEAGSDFLKVGLPHDAIIADRVFAVILKGATAIPRPGKISALGQLHETHDLEAG